MRQSREDCFAGYNFEKKKKGTGLIAKPRSKSIPVSIIARRVG